MVSIPNIGSTVTPAPVDNNRPSASERARTTANTPSIDPTARTKFVDRRRNRERRLQSRAPLIDTRRNKDRRRTGRLDILV